MNFGEREKRDWGHSRTCICFRPSIVSSSRTQLAWLQEGIISPATLHQPPPIHTIESRSILVSVSALEELELLFNVTEGDCRGTSDSFIGVDVVSNLGSVSLVSVPLSSSTANA